MKQIVPLAIMILLIDSTVTDSGETPKIERRQRGGGYAFLFNNPWRMTTQTKMYGKFRVMIMALLSDIHAKIEKMGFIKRWSEKGEKGKAAFTARLIFKAQRWYNKMVRMYTFTHDNNISMRFSLVINNFLTLKKDDMELDHLIQTILEYENEDPSGKRYGRTGPETEQGYVSDL